MPTAHFSDDQLRAYYERKLAPADLLAASDHVAECAECRARLARLEEVVRPTRRRDLSYDELVGWIDGTLDPLSRREVEEILASSPHARGQLDDLTRFREETNALPGLRSPGNLNAIARWILPLAAAIVVGLFAMLRGGGETLRDGGRIIHFARDGSPREMPAGLRAEVADTIRAHRLALPADIADLRGRNSVLAGAPNESAFRVVSPIATAVRDGRPEFRWTAQANADAYEVNVANAKSEIVASERLPANAREWQPYDALTEAQTYQWEVLALRDGAVIARSPAPPDPEARFKVLSREERAALEATERQATHSHLALATIKARAGLRQEALEEIAALEAENPGSPLVAELRDSLGN